MSGGTPSRDLTAALATLDGLTIRGVWGTNEARVREVRGYIVALSARVERLEAAIHRARTDLGMTAYEGTPVSVWSAKNIESYLGAAVVGEGDKRHPEDCTCLVCDPDPVLDVVSVPLPEEAEPNA